MSFYTGREQKFNSKYTKNKKKQDSPLVKIYNDVVMYSNKAFPKRTLPESICYDIYDITLDTTELEEYNDTTIQVDNMDTLDMAILFRREGLNPLVLNMASKFKPGGGVSKGATAQEEVIFRRTNACMTHPPEWYPLEDNEVIYSPQVHIFMDAGYKFMKESDQSVVSMLANHAIRRPNLYKGDFTNDDYDLTYSKIEAIFKIAIIHGHDSMVLGALGCGAYRNPPDEIVNIFKECLVKYKKYFKKIGFGILVVKDSDNINLTLFNELKS